MKHCDTQFKTLAKRKPAMARAVDNLFKDCNTSAQPHGNIPGKIAQSMSDSCNRYKDHEIDHLEGLVKQHRAIARPTEYNHVPAPHTHTLLRVQALSTFFIYHFHNGAGGPGLLSTTASILDLNVPHGYKKLLKELDEGTTVKGTKTYHAFELNGTTGKPDNPTWWTFCEKKYSRPNHGETYMKELALSGNEIKKARDDEFAVEISINPKDFNETLFKPTALDAFDPDTGFEPELTGKPYGYTAPCDRGLKSWPELVSKSRAYINIIKNNSAEIMVRKIPFS